MTVTGGLCLHFTLITAQSPPVWLHPVQCVCKMLSSHILTNIFTVLKFCCGSEMRSTVLGYQVSNISTCRTLPQHILNVQLQTWLSLNIPLSPREREISNHAWSPRVNRTSFIFHQKAGSFKKIFFKLKYLLLPGLHHILSGNIDMYI